MPRTGRIKPKEAETDPIYKDRDVNKLINAIMKSGKKSIAQSHVYGAFKKIKEKKKDPLQVFHQALKNIGPRKEVKPRRVGGASYLIPISVAGKRSRALAIRWLVNAARNRSNAEYKTFQSKLSAELLSAAANEGGAVQKKESTHHLAEANKAFSHFRW